MRKTRARYLIHGIVETGEVRRSDCSDVLETQVAFLRRVLERSLPCSSTEILGGDWSIAAQASFPGGHLAVRLYAPGMDPPGACASSMSVTYDPRKPPVLWASRASIHLAPDPWKAAAEVDDLELGLAWAWIPLVEAWIDEDWARTLDVATSEWALEQQRQRTLARSEGAGFREECRKQHGAGIDEERETDEWESYEQWDDMDYPYGDDPEDWAPVDLKQDWYRDEPDAEVPYHDHEDRPLG